MVGEGYEWEALNPLLGFAEESSGKIFEGLVALDLQNEPAPGLATSVPTPAADGLSWTATLRDGVTFHDGSTFDADDVVATYRAVLDPAYAATVRSNYSMLRAVEKLDGSTVRFDLAFPYALFADRLTLGILPTEALTASAPLENSPVNSAPVGTGPYQLREWRKGSSMTLDAYDGYWNGVPAVKTITVVFAEDDNTRAQRMRGGEFDATVLPPALAQTFADTPGYRVLDHKSADYRVVTMPMSSPVTGDPAIRLALNYAANRPQMISALLAGRGSPASTPVPEVLETFVEPAAQFRYDAAQAQRILDDAGWLSGTDGIRARNGQRAAFTLMYPTTDSVRKDLAVAVAFAADARTIGVDVALEGLGWDAIEPRLGQGLAGDGWRQPGRPGRGAAPTSAARGGATGGAVGGAAAAARGVARDGPELPGAGAGQHRQHPRGGAGRGAAGLVVDRDVPGGAARRVRTGSGRGGGVVAGSGAAPTTLGAGAVSLVSAPARSSGPARSRSAQLHVDELSVRFRLGAGGRAGTVAAVTDASFTLRPGRLLALVGESDCGKSVLAAAIMGLLPGNAEIAGRVELDGVELLDAPEPRLRDEVRGRRIGLVPQSAATHLTPVRRVGAQLAEAVRELRPADPNPLATVRALADRVGLPADVLGKYPHELSGGTAQRVGVAAALAGDPPVLLADEPTAGLDRPLVDRTVDLLAAMAADGHAVLLITHDLRAARRVATDLAVMYASRLVEVGPAEDLFDDPWHPYTRALLGALPDHGFTPLPGHPPELTALPPGCGFAARCPDRPLCSGDPGLRLHGERALACAPPVPRAPSC